MVMFVVGTTLKRYNRERFLSKRSDHAPRPAKIVALEGEREERRQHFISLGLRPLQVVLGISFCLYLISIVSQVWYYWPQSLLGRALFAITFHSLMWWFQFQYRRNTFLLLAAVIAWSLFSSIGHINDMFCVVSFSARSMVVITSLIIYTKMKPSTLTKRDDA